MVEGNSDGKLLDMSQMARSVPETRADLNQNPVQPKQEIIDYGFSHVSYTHTITVDLALANEALRKCKTVEEAKQYHTNCQRCVIAMETRRRGLDVKALPRIKDDDPLMKSDSKIGWPSVFENPDYHQIGPVTNKIALDCEEYFERCQPGSIAIMRVDNKLFNSKLFECVEDRS